MIKKKLFKLYQQRLISQSWLGAFLLLFFGFLLGSFWVSTQWIGHDVRQQCLNAQEKYQGDCVQALSALALDQRQKIWIRTQAIWALGQLGDHKALLTLEKLSRLPECRQANSDCFYALRKATPLVKGALNITAPFWRLSFK